MVNQDSEPAKKAQAFQQPPATDNAAAHNWTFKTGDSGSFTDSSSGSSSATGSGSDSGSGSDPDISDTSTHFGGPFQRAIALEPGAIIGGTYRIVRLIGKGGMGQVYLAEHMTLAKKCALKVMSSNQVTERAWKRFQTEAKAIAGLDHPNLVRVTDLGIHENSLPFFAMEYVDGKSLAQRLCEHGPMDLASALEVLLQICDGIECAHKQFIVHRDLKPANIMLVEDGANPAHFKVKILDFGLAKLSQREAAEAHLTATGEIFGSPLYMSPEQCAGEPTDIRSDIYSLGCTIFECLTGQPPFNGPMAIAIMNSKVFNEAPTLASLCSPKVFSAEIEQLVGKMLAKDAKERYQTIALLKADVQSAQSGKPLARSLGSQKENGDQNTPSSIKDSWREVSIAATSDKDKSRQILLALILTFLAACVIFPAIKSLVPSPPAGTFIMPAPLAELAGAEAWLARIQSAYWEQSQIAVAPGKNRYEAQFIDRNIAYSNIVSDAKAHLIALGERAIPACIKDLGLQTSSTNVSGQVLIANKAPGADALIGLLKQKPDLTRSITPLLRDLGSIAVERLCTQATSTRDEKEKAFAIKTLVQVVSQRRFPFFIGQPEREPRLMTEGNRVSLLALLKTEADESVRKDLIEALAYFKSPTPDAVSALSQVLSKDPSEMVQQEAAKTLGAMLIGASQYGSRDITNVLCGALSSPNQSEAVKVACLESLALTKGPIDPADLTVMRNAKKDPSDNVRQKAMQTLASMAARDNQYMPDLIAALEEPDPRTLSNALTTASSMGSRAKPTLPALIKLAHSDQPGIANRAIFLMGQVGLAGSPEGIAFIIKTLELPPTNENAAQILSAIAACRSMGPEAKQAVPALRRLVATESHPFDQNAESALTNIRHQ